MKHAVVLLCLLAVALPAAAAGPTTSPACNPAPLVSQAAEPSVELPWLTAEPAPPLVEAPLDPVFLAHPCCPSNHTQICSQACGGCGRGVCDDGACECLCC